MGDKDKKEEEPVDSQDSYDDEEDDDLLGAMDPTAAAMDAVNLDNYFPGADDENFKSLNKSTGKPVLQQCCCCICNCQTVATEGMTCCCVVPIKCGITSIGVLTLALAIIGISAQFFLILNDQVKWWFCVVNLVLLLPQYIAASFFVVWFGKDSVATRGVLGCGCIMVIVSQSLLAAWAIVYFIWIHQGDTVYYGWGTTEEGYVKFQKKYYLFRELAWAVIVIGLFSYFICICGRYSTALKMALNKEQKEEFKKEKEWKEKAEKALDALNSGKPDPYKRKKKEAKKDDAKSEKPDDAGSKKDAAEEGEKAD